VFSQTALSCSRYFCGNLSKKRRVRSACVVDQASCSAVPVLNNSTIGGGSTDQLIDMPGKTTIAAHADHVYFGLCILNRWAAGEANPWPSPTGTPVGSALW
jgi:hypothetical protein